MPTPSMLAKPLFGPITFMVDPQFRMTTARRDNHGHTRDLVVGLWHFAETSHFCELGRNPFGRNPFGLDLKLVNHDRPATDPGT
jgi:hypothetical protein